MSSKSHLHAPSDIALGYARPGAIPVAGPQEGLFDRAFAWWLSLALMLAALLVPIFAVEVPPLTDYPNHLARCYVLAFGQSDPVLRQMFSANWQIIPNIAVDLLLPAMMHVFSPLVAGRIILALCLLVPTTGAVALSYAYFQRRSFWQIAAGFAAFNALFLMGFMNFELGIGLAMWGAAAWIRYRERYPAATIVSGVVVATLVFFFHMFGFCFYALLIGSYELAVIFRTGVHTRVDLRYAAKRVASFAVVLLAPAILYLASPLKRVDVPAGWPHISQKLSKILVPFLDYSSLFDVMTVIPLVGFLIFWVIRRRASFSKAALIASIVLFCTYIALPVSFKGVYFVDTRLPVMLGFLFFAGFMPKGLSSRQRSIAVTLFATLFVARIAMITDIWMRSQRDLSDLRATIDTVEPGSRVLAADVVAKDNLAWYEEMPASRRLPELTPTYWHLASFVLLDRRAFWPNIFAEEYQQPIVVKEPYHELQAFGSPPPSYEDLELPLQQVPASELSRFPYLANWTKKFDYVLLLNAEGAPRLENFLPNRLQLVERQGIAALFRVKK
jgi:hypothetical protein